jgi:hypothetical protein
MPFASRPARTPDGPEAATWTRNGTAEFDIWRQDSEGLWSEIARTTYPTNTGLQRCAPLVTGAAITGSSDAVFIVHECFAGDGSDHAAAIGNGLAGWGVIVQPSAHRMVSTGPGGEDAPSSAIHWDIEFDNGGIATSDNAGNFGVAGSNEFPRIQIWGWHNGGFVVVADSVFRAHAGTRPNPSARGLTGQGCPKNGTYAAAFSAGTVYERTAPPNAPIRIQVFTANTDSPAVPSCTEFVSPLIPVSVHVGYTPNLLAYHYRTITNRHWITGPAWLLLQGVGFPAPAPIFYRHLTDNPWFIPSSLHDNVLLSKLKSHPTPGTVTFRSGALVSLVAS